ncbi:MAG: AAA family ATPase [Burkholderiales bacterium]|nr:AAA family ATPase [Phycisphaerae bacterium]
MRLRKLVLHGFKSFADRTEFLFDQPVTCVVGPNGCGKSNVVDAVKWVLGEQSAKSLRGEAMLDVIFNGSGNRKPAGMAEVVLVFDNPIRDDGNRVLNLPVEEVAVGRRLYRDSTSEYTINGQVSRLKDIRDLFLDTGVGVDAYSVIEQGRVAQLLESNPQQRRIIFEEAAGISRFKVKKKETQRKLEKVDQNLLRVNDIVLEVDRRLRSVKVQASRARTYQEYSVRLNELRLGYSLQEYHKLHGEFVRVEKEKDETQFRVDDVAGDLAKRQNELATTRDQADQIGNSKQRAEHELVEAQALVRAAHQKQEYARQQLKQIAEQIESLARDSEASQARQAEISGQLESEAANLQQLTAELDSRRAEIEQKQQAFKDGQLTLNKLVNQIEDNKQGILELMRQLSRVNSRLASIDIERKNIAANQERQGDRRRQVVADTETATSLAGELSEKLAGVHAQIGERQAEQNDRKTASSELGQQIKQITEQLGAAKEHRSALVSRQKLLQDLEARREGVSDAVKNVLKNREQQFPFVQGIVADLMRVDVEHAQAIEAALDGRDQWLVVDSVASVPFESLRQLSGRVSFVERAPLALPSGEGSSLPLPPGEGWGEGASSDQSATSESSPLTLTLSQRERELAYDWNQHPQKLRLATDLVKFEQKDASVVHTLLGKTAVVDTFEDAIALQQSGPAGWRYVITGGALLESDGVLKAGPHGASMGLLSRRSELDALVLQIAETDDRIAQLSTELNASSEQAREVEEQINQLRNAIYQLNTHRVEITSQSQQITDRLTSLSRELPLLDRELQNLLDQTGRLTTEQATLTEQRQTQESRQQALQVQIEEFSTQQIELVEQVKHLAEDLTTCRVSLGQVQEKQLGARQAVDRLRSQQQEIAQQIERMTRSINTAADRRGVVEAELQHGRHDEETHTRRADELREAVANLVAQLQTASEAVRTLTGKVESIRGLHGELEQRLHALQLQHSELGVRRESLATRTQDELQIDVATRYQEEVDRHAAAQAADPNAVFPYSPGATDWERIGTEIKDLKDKIHRLGNVNLDSIGEMDELEQRSQFYATQLADLAQAKAQMEQLIDEINKESSVRFEQTFNAVREHFQHLFRKLFGGGSADVYLELEVEDTEAMKAAKEAALPGEPVAVMRKTVDPLDAGIEIMARPPGKKPVSISQLSGGEKAMTCIALLMSIFKSKPSPFCILDEVDAPLDEANNVRFGLIVQEFLSLSQFIIITHHKRTMQIGDLLYGVTMQEQGVSKRVAVKFDQVQSGGRISDAVVAEAEKIEQAEAVVEEADEHVAA